MKLYTTHCPVCMGIEMQLKKSGIVYEECTDKEELIRKGYTHPPVLEGDDGKVYTGVEITNYIKKIKRGK